MKEKMLVFLTKVSVGLPAEYVEYKASALAPRSDNSCPSTVTLQTQAYRKKPENEHHELS
jgi:hypothetical protein